MRAEFVWVTHKYAPLNTDKNGFDVNMHFLVCQRSQASQVSRSHVFASHLFISRNSGERRMSHTGKTGGNVVISLLERWLGWSSDINFTYLHRYIIKIKIYIYFFNDVLEKY